MAKPGGAMKGLGGLMKGGGATGMIVLVTISAEELGSFFMFECPCDNTNFLYGATYLFGPALLLFLGGIALQSTYWRLITGLFKRGRVRYIQQAKRSGTTSGFDKMKIFLKTLIKCMIQSLPAPLSWLMVGLLRGEHVTCALWPTRPEDYPECADDGSSFPLSCQIPKTYDEAVESCAATHARNLRSHSHLVAWVGIIMMLVTGLVVLSLVACGSYFTYHQKTFIGNYKKSENKIMKQKLEERADALASECIEEFLDVKRHKEDWDRVSLIQDQMLRMDAKGKIEGKHFVYTPLHGFISEQMAKEGKTAFDLIERDSSSSSDSSDCEKEDQGWKRQKKRKPSPDLVDKSV